MSILYLRISNLKTSKFIGNYFSPEIQNPDNSLHKEIITKADDIINNLKIEDGYSKRNFSFKNFKDKKIDIYYLITSTGFIYLAFIELYTFYLENFKNETIFELFEDVEAQGIKKLTDKNGILTKVGEQNLKFSIEKYQNTYLSQSGGNTSELIKENEGSNKIEMINSHINEVKNDMSKNIKNMITNVNDMNEIEGKSVAIKNTSEEFMNSSKTLEKKMKCNSLKTKIICIISIAIFAIILLYILFK